MKLKPNRIKVSAKDQGTSIRMEINALDKNNGRKVFSFNLYETDLEEVMKLLVVTFEAATQQLFPGEIKKELGMDPGTIIIKKRKRGEKAAFVEQVKTAILNGNTVLVPGVTHPDGWIKVLESLGLKIEAEPATVNGEVTGYRFFQKKE